MRGQGKYQAERGVMSEKVREELAEWIDSRVIAEAILDELEDQELELTVANGQRVWLDVLENGLPGAIQSTVKAIF